MAGTAAGLRFLKRAKHYHKELGVSGFFHRGQTLKKHTYLTRVFGLRHGICSNPFFRFGSRSQVTNWKGDLAIVFLFWPDFRKYICDLFFLPQVSTCREGKLGGFFSLFLWPPIPFGVSTGSRVRPFFGPLFPSAFPS